MRTLRVYSSRAAALIVGALAALLGCTTESQETEAAPSTEALRFIDEYCATSEPCCDGLESAERGVCREGLLREARSGATYDATRASACLAAARDAARASDFCAKPPPAIACKNLFLGVKPEGAVCDHDFECAAPSDGWAECSSRLCNAYHPANEGDDCAYTLVEGAFDSLRSTGGSFKGSYRVGVCFASRGLFCREGKCGRQIPLGQPCTIPKEPHRCEQGAYCKVRAAPIQCARLSAPGESCDPADEDASGYRVCTAGHFCSMDSKTCVPLPAVGSACKGYCSKGAAPYLDAEPTLDCRDEKCQAPANIATPACHGVGHRSPPVERDGGVSSQE